MHCPNESQLQDFIRLRAPIFPNFIVGEGGCLDTNQVIKIQEYKVIWRIASLNGTAAKR